MEMRHITVFWLATNPEDVRILALEIVQKPDPDVKVGKYWIRGGLCGRHPGIRLRWGRQLDFVRALRGSKGNYRAIKLFFMQPLVAAVFGLPRRAYSALLQAEYTWSLERELLFTPRQCTKEGLYKHQYSQWISSYWDLACGFQCCGGAYDLQWVAIGRGKLREKISSLPLSLCQPD